MMVDRSNRSRRVQLHAGVDKSSEEDRWSAFLDLLVLRDRVAIQAAPHRCRHPIRILLAEQLQA